MRLFIGLLFCSLSVFAQHNNRSARDLQFRFGNPGARSLGFGGAFIALADDATAPVANPAGMVRTHGRSMSVEFNYGQMDNHIPFHSGTLLQTNIFEFDFDFESSEAPEKAFQVPFLSAVFQKGRWRSSVFAHLQANIKRNYRTESIILCDINSNFYPNCEQSLDPTTNPPSTDFLDLEMANFGISGAFEVSETFSLGVSLFFSDLDYQADSILEIPETLDVVEVGKLARGNDSDWGGVFGLLWQVTPELSFGATYKRQPEFEYLAELTKEREIAGIPDAFSTIGQFKIPDAVGFGVSVSPLDHLTINLDANRVFYSQVTDDLIDYSSPEESDENRITQTMPDITEIHLGMEWIFTQMSRPLSLRFGYWLEPYHAATNNVEDSQILSGTVDDPRFRDIFFLHQFEQDENHYSLGMGWTFERYLQLDFAVELADQSESGVVSGIYRF